MTTDNRLNPDGSPWTGPLKTPDVHHYCALHPFQENAYVDADLDRWACNCCSPGENHMRTVPVDLPAA